MAICLLDSFNESGKENKALQLLVLKLEEHIESLESQVNSSGSSSNILSREVIEKMCYHSKRVRLKFLSLDIIHSLQDPSLQEIGFMIICPGTELIAKVVVLIHRLPSTITTMFLLLLVQPPTPLMLHIHRLGKLLPNKGPAT